MTVDRWYLHFSDGWSGFDSHEIHLYQLLDFHGVQSQFCWYQTNVSFKKKNIRVRNDENAGFIVPKHVQLLNNPPFYAVAILEFASGRTVNMADCAGGVWSSLSFSYHCTHSCRFMQASRSHSSFWSLIMS